MAKNNAPVHTIRIGYVKASIWQNGEHHNVTVVRAYKDNEGKWQDGDSFSHGDLPTLAKVAEMACDWISEQ